VEERIAMGPSLPTEPGALTGKVLGPYRILTQLGDGGMGTVWYAEHAQIGRRVAIKVLHPHLAVQGQNLARFIREARAVNAIRHPNIVDVTDFGEAEGLHFLVMELLEGETLGARLERENVLDPPITLHLAKQVGLALSAAHQREIIHRDLKPENIFIVGHEDYPDHVKVLDFGIAKLTESKGFGSGTRPGMVLGTPAYMSPEQCLGDTDLDHRSDQYSLAVVIFEMLVGHPPFLYPTFGRMVIAHTQEPPPSADEENPVVPRALSKVLQRALAKQPDERFDTMGTFLEELLRASDGARPMTRAERDFAAQKKRMKTRKVGRELDKILRRRFAYGRAELPAIPVILSDALRELDSPSVDLAALALSLERDPLVASRLLRVVNSPTYAGRERISSVRQAVNRLGIQPLRALLLELSARQIFVSRNPEIRRIFRQLWEHCVAVGALSRGIAHRLSNAPEPDEAYVAGLLHDIGKPIVAAYLLDAERQLLEQLGDTWLEDSMWLKIVESAHQNAGRAVAESWNLPEEVLMAIREQKHYQHDGGPTMQNIVLYANSLARLCGLDAGHIDQDADQKVVMEGRKVLGTDEQLEETLTRHLVDQVGAMTQEDHRSPRR
jgi:putative nucleotidyltransferase with HDIG domain